MQVCKQQLGSCANVFSYAGCLTTFSWVPWQCCSLAQLSNSVASRGLLNSVLTTKVTLSLSLGSELSPRCRTLLVAVICLTYWQTVPNQRCVSSLTYAFMWLRLQKQSKKCFLTTIKSKINIWNLICRLAKMQACKEVEVPHLNSKHHHSSVLLSASPGTAFCQIQGSCQAIRQLFLCRLCCSEFIGLIHNTWQKHHLCMCAFFILRSPGLFHNYF